MNKIVFWLCILISAVLYYSAPLKYDRFFCVVCLLLFLVEAFLIVRHDIKHINLLNFNILFYTTFFLCTYVYPVFLVGETSIIGLLIESKIPTINTINKCVSLSTLAISIYSMTYSHFRHKNGTGIAIKEKSLISGFYTKIRCLFIPVLFIMLFVLLNHLSTEHDGNEVNEAPYLFQLFYYLLPMFVVCAVLININNQGRRSYINKILINNKLIFILLSIIIFLFLYIGDRFPIIAIVLVFISSTSLFVKQIKWQHLIVGFLVGVLLMFALRVTRQGSDSISAGGVSQFVSATQTSIMDNASPWDVFADLVGINIELNTGMDYVNREGHLYPAENFVIHISSPIPFLPTILSRGLFNIERPQDIAPGVVIGEYINYTSGNHCVIDIYMPYGVIGVIVVFLLFGLLNAKVSNGLNKSLYCKMLYIYLMSFSVFIVRNSIINIYRVVVLSFITYYILMLLSTKNKKMKIQRA